jgi:hypothetical protein
MKELTATVEITRNRILSVFIALVTTELLGYKSFPVSKAETQDYVDEASVSEHEASVCEHETSVCEQEAIVCEQEVSVCEHEASVCEHEASVCEHKSKILTLS